MSDKDKFNEDDEYHFVDEPDMSGFEAQEPQQTSAPGPSYAQPEESKSFLNVPQIFDAIKPVVDMIKQNLMLRTSLIVFSLLLVSLVVYRCSMDPLAKKSTEKMTAVTMDQPKTRPTTPVTSSPLVENTRLVVQETPTPAAQNKLDHLEKTQADLQAQISALSTQMTNVNNNLTTMMTNLKGLNEQVVQLAVTVQNEAKVTAGLGVQLKQQQSKPMMARKINIPIRSVQYYLQAVIPGRAWIVSSEGQTLTVREGTRVANYGVVRYIDAKRGRVLTSSGQIIKFSQEDS